MQPQAGDDLLNAIEPPYVLLEDRLGADARAGLYVDPVQIVCCDEPGEIDPAFAQIEAGLAQGLHAAGVLSYELGYVLEPKLVPLIPPRRDFPLLWFGLFRSVMRIDPEALDQAMAERGPPPPLMDLGAGHDRAEHVDKVRQALALIAAGDIYQVNLTFPMRFGYDRDPLALYAALRARQPVAHGGVACFGDTAVLSVSPELWIDLGEGRATTRPMKGTAARGGDPEADRAAALALAMDPKQRAENLMIVDLLRNDLSRISRPGSVRTPALFTVETYPSFHTLTSTVTGELRPGTSLRDRMAALFPCGSIVGAPKVRASEVIRTLEAVPRGAYTGALGVIAPNGDMRFNVAIRTAVLRADGTGTYGVGGGIVADSDPDAEYDEALLKARVLSDLATDYGLIETLRWSPEQGFIRLAGHLERLERSARRLGFGFNRSAILNGLEQSAAAWPHHDGDRRVRAVLSRDGVLEVTTQPAPSPPSRVLRVRVADQRLDAGDPFLRHKTTRRDIHEAAFAEAAAGGFDDALLLNRRGALADASRNTIFAEIGGVLLTPPVRAGALPGVLRAELLAQARAREADLSLADLERATHWFLGNSLNGLRQAILA
ncbi:MAG TPA: aminodeoxychorismate synthase component I [Caulobacteraceae bacterium]|nr:aminodeoxychorismate synthase component I [Caulobacteraceae bacterium]